MYAFDYISDVNSTSLLNDENKTRLTPGQIATITIVSVFLFYFTIMFIVCLAEYCQYINGKKAKPVRHSRSQPPISFPANDTDARPRSHIFLETSTSLSDIDQRTLSFNSVNSYRISERYSKLEAKHSTKPSDKHNKSEKPSIEDPLPGHGCSAEDTTPVTLHKVDVHCTGGVDSHSSDHLTDCSSLFVTSSSENDMSIQPLIARSNNRCERLASNEFSSVEEAV